MIKSFFLLFILLFFGGCSQKGVVPESTNFNELSFHITSHLLDSLKIDIAQNEPLLVADFVNTKTLKNQSELGFLLSNSLKHTITKRTNFLVQEIEISNEIIFGKDGLSALSRELKNGTKEYHGRYILIGTYTIMSSTLVVFTKIVDFQTGNIIASSTQNIPISKDILKLETKQRQIYTPVVI